MAECVRQLIEWPNHPDKHLMDAAEEEGTAFLCEHRYVLGWEVEPLLDRVVLEISAAGHSAQPLSRIALVDAGPPCQLRAGGGTVGGQILEQVKAVADGRHHRHGSATGVGQDFAQERLGLRLIDGCSADRRCFARHDGQLLSTRDALYSGQNMESASAPMRPPIQSAPRTGH